jgi:hypothetical protein
VQSAIKVTKVHMPWHLTVRREARTLLNLPGLDPQHKVLRWTLAS